MTIIKSLNVVRRSSRTLCVYGNIYYVCVWTLLTYVNSIINECARRFSQGIINVTDNSEQKIIRHEL